MTRGPGRQVWVLALAGTLEGLLLGAGLETCFGVGRYRLIMALGAAGGAGIGGLVWLIRRLRNRRAVPAKTLWWVGAGLPGAVFLFYVAFRVLPLILIELSYRQ